MDASDHHRLYIDESGDHVFNELADPSHRYLCLLGCWFRSVDYREFHEALESFKFKHLPHTPDDPVVLHREDIVNRRGAFWRLRDEGVRAAFDTDLLQLIAEARFRMAAVVIDKKTLWEHYQTPAQPYHFALGLLLYELMKVLTHWRRRLKPRLPLHDGRLRGLAPAWVQS